MTRPPGSVQWALTTTAGMAHGRGCSGNVDS